MWIATLQQLLLFALVAAAIAVAPGPDNLGTLSVGLSRGRAAAFAFAGGCALGCLTHTLWAAIGVTALLAASPVAFTVLKIAGAIYLGYLGILAIRHAGAAHLSEAIVAAEPPRRFLLRGFVANAINPKVALFFFAFLPQFVRVAPDAPPRPVQIGLLGVTFALVTIVVFGTIALFAGQVGAWLRARPIVGRRLDQLTGILFLCLGVRLLLQGRTH